MTRAWLVHEFPDGDAYAIPLHDDGVDYPPDPIEWLEALMRGDFDAS